MPGDEVVVGAGLDDPAVVDHDDLIGAPHRGEPVSDGDRRPAAAELVEGTRPAWVERRPDPCDRRATLVTLTARGRQVAAGIRAARAAEAEGFFARLDEADRTSLARILRTLRN